MKAKELQIAINEAADILHNVPRIRLQKWDKEIEKAWDILDKVYCDTEALAALEPCDWIPVSKRLPKKDGQVWIAYEITGYTYHAYYDVRYKKWSIFDPCGGFSDIDFGSPPTHWKPIVLPKQPCQPKPPCQTCGGSKKVPANEVGNSGHTPDKDVIAVIPCPDCQTKPITIHTPRESYPRTTHSKPEQSNEEFIKEARNSNLSLAASLIGKRNFYEWSQEACRRLEQRAEQLPTGEWDEPEQLSGELKERLAEVAHTQWSGWIKYMFGKCRETCPEDGKLFRKEVLVIPEWAVERWTHQANTEFAKLSDKEKDSDRTEADKFLAVFATYIERLENELRQSEKTLKHVRSSRNTAFELFAKAGAENKRLTEQIKELEQKGE